MLLIFISHQVYGLKIQGNRESKESREELYKSELHLMKSFGCIVFFKFVFKMS